MADEYLSVDQVAAIAGVKPATVRRWLREGYLSGKRTYWQWRVLRSDLDRFMRDGSNKE
jgi:excisionase family DNA binding protein